MGINKVQIAAFTDHYCRPSECQYAYPCTGCWEHESEITTSRSAALMMEGTRIGAYRIVKLLGCGGMSHIWVAEHTLLERRAAIKVLRPELSSRPEVVAQFFNEARITAAVANPGIVQVFDFGFHTDGSAYIVMELLDGETLDCRLARSGVLAIADALQILRQVATALHVAHARGVVHRDLKPDNIFLARDPEVSGGERAKILDFGIAIWIGDRMMVQESCVLGAPPFMSPEQCRGSRQVDQQSDIYSLGCVLFTLVTGRPPFDGAGGDDVMAMHLRQPTPVPSQSARGISSAIDPLVMRCMAKDPEMRFTASTLTSAIDALTPGIGYRGDVAAVGAGSRASPRWPHTRQLRAAGGSHSRRLYPPWPLDVYKEIQTGVSVGRTSVAFHERGPWLPNVGRDSLHISNEGESREHEIYCIQPPDCPRRQLFR